MKNLFAITFIFVLLFNNIKEVESMQNSDEELMTNLLNQIIETPGRMFEIMENSTNINCNKLIYQLKQDEWRLISFTLDVAYLRCRGYIYDGIDEYKTTTPNKISIHYHYVINKGLENEHYKIFRFYKEEGKISFDGVIPPNG